MALDIMHPAGTNSDVSHNQQSNKLLYALVLLSMNQ